MKKSIVALLFLMLTAPAMADWTMNMSEGVTPISKDMYFLHMTAIWVCVAIGILVFGVMIYSLIVHRKSRGYEAASFHEHPVLEVTWATIPFIILIILAIPATRVLINMDDSGEADVTIKVVGYQWKWQYQYLDQNIRFFSNLSTPYDQIQNKTKKGKWYLLEVDNPVVVPVNKKVRFLVTASDVLHSWWVPKLGIKRDAVPGFVHEAWAKIETPGTYRGQCAELCGVNHGFMPIVVKAVSEEEFEKWVASKNPNAVMGAGPKIEHKKVSAVTTAVEPVPQAAIVAEKPKPEPKPKTLTKNELMEKGKDVYTKYCVACHKEDGTGMPPIFPAMKASSVAVGHPISRHINIVLHGVPGSAMQAFAEQMTDEEIAAVVTYERNAWGNNTGELVQAADIAALREE